MNYFGIFEITEQFELDEKILQDKYIQLQKKYHPDMAKNEEEKNKFIVIAADLNQAYATLKNPYKRASYILKLQNIDIEKEGRDAYKLPPELLSSILEKREELEEIEGYDNILAFKKAASKERERIIGELTGCFRIICHPASRLSSSPVRDDILLTILLKYQDNLIEAINQKLEKCF